MYIYINLENNNIINNDNSLTKFNILKGVKNNTFLFEHTNYRLPSSTRLLLYNLQPDIILSVDFNNINNYFKEKLQNIITTSVVLCTTYSSNINDKILLLFLEYSLDQDTILLNGYITTFNDLNIMRSNYFYKQIYPIQYQNYINNNSNKLEIDEYNYLTHKIIIILDLDKTLIVSDSDLDSNDQVEAFISDFEINGKLSINNEPYTTKIMIRNGCYWFLRRLAIIGEIFVVTAGDLNYAREIIIAANNLSWITSRDPTTNELDNLEKAEISLSNVFSVRSHINSVNLKTFSNALPFDYCYATTIIIDDNQFAWELESRKNLITISAFQPLNNSYEHLLNIANVIEKATILFYNNIFVNYSLDQELIDSWIQIITIMNNKSLMNIIAKIYKKLI